MPCRAPSRSAAGPRSRPDATSCFIATASSPKCSEVAAAAPLLSGEAARRAEAALSLRKAPEEFDAVAARNDFQQHDRRAGRTADELMNAAADFAHAGELIAPTSEPALIVDVEGFEGPLDLLLMLARQQKVDLAKISILALADQYLDSSKPRASCALNSPPIIW